MIEMEPEYLNTGVMTKVDHLVQDGLSEPVAKRLREAAGPDWLVKLNAYCKYTEKNAIREINGRPNWDFNKILHGVEFLAEFNKRERRIQWTARQLVNIRNAKSHGKAETIQTDASFIKTFEFLRLANDMLNYFGAGEQLRELNELTDSINKSISYRGASVQTAGAPDQATNEQLAPEQPAAGDPPIGPPKQPPVAASASTGAAPAGRATSLPAPGPGVSWFPIVGEGGGDFGYFKATRLPETDPRATFYAPGLAQNKREAFQQIIDATRADEKDDVVSAATTRIRMDPGQFSGLSFGLAAAIADRTARYGRAAAFEKATVIATGVVLAQRHGEVGAIDLFSEKVALIDNSAATKELADILFVFPKANFASADDASRATLARWSAGARIRWRAVSHLDDLDDLLPQAVGPVTEVPDEAASVPSKAIETPPPVTSVRVPDAGSRGVGTVYRKALLLGGGLGLAILAGAASLSIWVLGSKPDPVMVQASDDRIHAVVLASEGAAAAPADLDRCAALGQKVAALTDFDRARLSGDVGAAIIAANDCRSRFEASDGRLDSLMGAVEKLDRGEGSADDAARALQTLTAFDMARPHDASQTYAIDRGKQAVGDIEASQRRIDQLADLWATKHESTAGDYIRSLRAALNGLTESDFARAEGPQRLAVNAARSYLESVDLSDRRLESLRNAVANYADAPDALHARACMTALDAMTAADKQRLGAGESGIVAKAASCGVALSASQSRLDVLMKAYSELRAAEAKGSGIDTALLRLKSAADSMTEFDRSALSDDQRAVVRAAENVSEQLSESDKRISNAAAYVQAALVAQQRVSGSFFKSFQQSINDLTNLDYDRMDLAMQQQIERACSLQPPLPPGSIAPVQSFTCRRAR